MHLGESDFFHLIDGLILAGVRNYGAKVAKCR